MKIALVGAGKIGSHILDYLVQSASLQVDAYDIDNYQKLKDREYDIIFLTTPMKAVAKVRQVIRKEPLVITTIKGIYKNKLVCDYFKNIVSLNGYYTPQTFEPKFCLAKKERFVETTFPFFPKFKMDSREALTANYLKNMYLVVLEKMGEKKIKQDITKLSLNRTAESLLLEDLEKSKELKSRNYLFSKMVYKEGILPSRAVAELGLVEGVESFISSDCFFSDFLTKIRKEFIKDLNNGM